MKHFRITFLFALTSLLFVSCKGETKPSETTEINHKIVSLNGAITEILSALGYQNQIVGVDVTSTYPQNIKEKAQDLGHVRSISIENIISLQPTLVLASSNDLNSDLINKLQEAKIEVKIIEQEQSLQGAKMFVKEVAEAIQTADYSSIIEKIDSDFTNLNTFEIKPKVLFVYARGTGVMQVAGKNTPMQKMIEIAGGENAVNDFENFKPLTPEALIQSNPDYILLFNSGLESLGGIDGLLQIPGVNQTNAGKNQKIISMDGALLSSFGPRTGQAAKELNALLSK